MTTGQIQAPSSFELWWEKKRTTIRVLATVVLAAVLAYHGLKLYNRLQTDKTWSNFAVTGGLQAGYTEPGGLAQFVQQNPNFLGGYLESVRTDLLTRLPEEVGRISDEDFAEAIEAARGTEREPLLLWLAANKALEARDHDRAEMLLRELQEKHPDSFLNRESDYPPQYRRDLNPPDPSKPAPQKRHTPELAEPVKGSIVGLTLAQIAADRKFAAEHPKLYTAPEPTSEKVALVKTDYGDFKIRFFADAAPKHYETFLTLANEKHFDNMAIDQIKRAGASDSPWNDPVEEMHFGLVATKQEQDRSKWEEERRELEKDVTAIEFENSGISHFPFMVAASAGKEGKSLPGRIWINVDDASAEHDGRRVVFGRVVEGQDVVRRLVLDPVFATEDERQRGSGTPRDTIRIQSVTIE